MGLQDLLNKGNKVCLIHLFFGCGVDEHFHFPQPASVRQEPDSEELLSLILEVRLHHPPQLAVFLYIHLLRRSDEFHLCTVNGGVAVVDNSKKLLAQHIYIGSKFFL